MHTIDMQWVSYGLLPMVYPVVDVRCILRSMPKDKTTPIDANKANVNALDLPHAKPERKLPDYSLLARLVLREGKSFYHSAMQAGYAESVASRGLKALLAESAPVSKAFKKESESFAISVDKLRPLAINRLYLELIDPNSNNGMKAVELTGKLKELDMFVRGTETNIGILVNMHEEIPTNDTQAIDVSPE